MFVLNAAAQESRRKSAGGGQRKRQGVGSQIRRETVVRSPRANSPRSRFFIVFKKIMVFAVLCTNWQFGIFTLIGGQCKPGKLNLKNSGTTSLPSALDDPAAHRSTPAPLLLWGKNRPAAHQHCRGPSSVRLLRLRPWRA